MGEGLPGNTCHFTEFSCRGQRHPALYVAQCAEVSPRAIPDVYQNTFPRTGGRHRVDLARNLQRVPSDDFKASLTTHVARGWV